MQFLVFSLCGIGAEASGVLQYEAKTPVKRVFFGIIKWCFIGGIALSAAAICKYCPVESSKYILRDKDIFGFEDSL